MHHSFAIAIVLAAPFVAAQSLSSIPSCALPAVKACIQKTGCDLSNTACICGATSLLDTVKQQISMVCSAADQETTINNAQQYCSQAGVPLAFLSSPSSSPSTSPVSPRDSITDVLILPLAQPNASLSILASSIPFPTSNTPSTSPTNSSTVSLSSITSSSSILASSTMIAAPARNTLPPALIMPVGPTCPPPTTVTFYTTTTLSESSSFPLPVSTFPSPIPSIASLSSPSAAILLSSTSPSLSAASSVFPSAAASSSSLSLFAASSVFPSAAASSSPSSLTLTSTIQTISSTSTLTLYSTLPSFSSSSPSASSAAPYALPNTTSLAGMNTTNATNTTAMPFTGAAAKGGRMQIGWATFAVVGVGAVGVFFL